VPHVFICSDAEVMSEVIRLLIDSCQSGDLVLIAAALDAFYDIFSEEVYNEQLLEHGVIQQMAQGAASLHQIYVNSK